MIFANSTSGSKFAKNAVLEPFLVPKSPKNPLSEPLWRHFGLLGTSWAGLLTHWGRLLGLLALSCGASGATKPALWSPLAPAGLPKWTPAAQSTEKLQNLMLFAAISLSFSATKSHHCVLAGWPRRAALRTGQLACLRACTAWAPCLHVRLASQRPT